MSEDYYDYDDDGFADYVETTTDPGYYLIAATLIFCIVSNMMLPCYVSLGHRYQKRRATEEDDATPKGQSSESQDSTRHDALESVPMSEAFESCRENASSLASSSSSLSAYGKRMYHMRSLMGSGSPLEGNADDPSAVPTDEASQSILMSLPDFSPPQRVDRRANTQQSAPSTVSTGPAASSISYGSATSVIDAGILSPMKRRRGGRARRRRGLEERRRFQYQEMLESNRRMMADMRDDGSDGVSASPSEPWLNSGPQYALSDKKALSEPLPPTRHRSRPSNLDPRTTWSDLVTDTLTPDDAADAEFLGLGTPENLAIEDVDLCCGKNAWWRPSMLVRGWNYLLDLMDWDCDMKRLVQLAVPFSAAAVVEGALDLVAIALVGHYIGTEALAAYVTVDLLVGISSEFVGGVCDTITVLCPHAIGSKNYFLAGQYVQISTILYSVAMVPIILLWFFATHPVMIWFGFQMETAVMAQDYASVIVFVELIDGIHEVYQNFLSVIDRELWATMLSIAEELLAALVLLFCVLTHKTTLTQVGVIYLFVSLFMTFVDIVYTVKKGWVRKYMNGMIRDFSFKNQSAVITTLKTAAPLCLGGLISYGEWEVLTLFAGYLGPAEVAAWGILGSLWDTVESTSEGVADAGEIRCAHHLGAGRPKRAREAAYKCILLGVFASSLLTSIVLILGEDMATWFTSDPTLQQMVIDVLPLIGIGNITLTAGTVCWSLVGAQGRYRLATIVSVVASWGVTMPLGALFTYGWRLNLQGLASAVVVGYSVTGTTLTYILIMSDWAKIGKDIVEVNAVAEEGSSSSSSSSSPSSSSSSSLSEESVISISGT